jgi:hypothetical protein
MCVYIYIYSCLHPLNQLFDQTIRRRCLQRLQELGHSYGDMPAHNLLWEGCAASSADLTARYYTSNGLDVAWRLLMHSQPCGGSISISIGIELLSFHLQRPFPGASTESSVETYVNAICAGWP